jgi:hypothetical protein
MRLFLNNSISALGRPFFHIRGVGNNSGLSIINEFTASPFSGGLATEFANKLLQNKGGTIVLKGTQDVLNRYKHLDVSKNQPGLCSLDFILSFYLSL